MQTKLAIGLMSGTSLDGIDACLLGCEPSLRIIASDYQAYPEPLRNELKLLIETKQIGLEQLARLQVVLSELYANSVSTLLTKAQVDATDISVIGCHGQTVFHLPDGEQKYSLQLGSGAHLAELCNIPVITDFRNNDMALGGQGAPLVCAFHKALCPEKANQLFINFGGIANLTWIPEVGPILGYDTGPANALLDLWYQLHNSNGLYDENGQWANTGKVSESLLKQMLSDDYFSLPAPKSTGKEYFNLQWLKNNLHAVPENLAPQDVQATLVQLSAETVIKEINKLAPSYIYIFGGGTHNRSLISAISAGIELDLQTTEVLGIEGDMMEAAAFGWLAQQCLNREPGTLCTVTGSEKNALTGAIYYPSP